MMFRYLVLQKIIDTVGERPRPCVPVADIAQYFPSRTQEEILSAIHLLHGDGLVSFSWESKGKFFNLCAAPHARAYLEASRELKQLKLREKWENRAYGFVSGVLITLVSQWLLGNI